MKIVRFGTKGQMVLLGLSSKDAKWYKMDEPVKKYISNFKEGDQIEIKSEMRDGKEVLLYISKSGGNGSVVTQATQIANPPKAYTQPDATPVQQSTNKWEKSPEINDSIKRQAIAHATSRTLIALQGQVNVNNIEAVMEQVYNKYVKLVG